MLYGFLTDDMGNTVTGGNVSLYVNGTFSGEIESIEGYVNLTYLTTNESGYISVYGNYDRYGTYSIDINNGQLLIADKTNVKGEINLDKKEYKVNETVNGVINVINEGIELLIMLKLLSISLISY